MKASHLIEFITVNFGKLFGASDRLRLVKVRLQATDLLAKYSNDVTAEQLAFFLIVALCAEKVSPKEEVEQAFLSDYWATMKHSEEETTLSELTKILGNISLLLQVKHIKIDLLTGQSEVQYKTGAKFLAGFNGDTWQQPRDFEKAAILYPSMLVSLHQRLINQSPSTGTRIEFDEANKTVYFALNRSKDLKDYYQGMGYTVKDIREYKIKDQ